MKTLIIKDNSFNNVNEFDSIKRTYNILINKSLNQLEKEGVFVFPDVVRDSSDLDDNQIILQKYDGIIKTGNVMGFLGCKDERLIISSRFSEDNDYFFQYLLNKVFNIPNIINFESEAESNSSYLDLLIYMFPFFLSKAVKKGIFKTYVKEEMNDSNIKGTIDIARHIKENIPFRGTISYNKKEYSYDNYVTELIRHTIEFIKLKPNGHAVLDQVNAEVKIINDNTRKYSSFDKRKIINYNQKHLINHAYYHEYILLQRICLYILLNQKHQIGIGNINISGIIFDGAWLWEEYVNTLLKDSFHHPQNKANKGHQYLFSDNRTGKIYPDFIGKDESKQLVADAKYKPEKNIGKQNKDYFQLLSYMFRFDAKTGLFIYPESENCQAKELFLNRGNSYNKNVEKRNDIKIVEYGFYIPECDSYQTFINAMKQIEEKTKKDIAKLETEV